MGRQQLEHSQIKNPSEIIDASFDGQGQVVVSGTKLRKPVMRTNTIKTSTLVAEPSGSATIVVGRYTPTGGLLGSSTSLGNLVLSAAEFSTSTVSWNVSAGDVLEFTLSGTISDVKKIYARLMP